MLAVSSSAFAEMIGQAYDCYPEEACGLLIGRLRGARVGELLLEPVGRFHVALLGGKRLPQLLKRQRILT